MRCEHAVCLSVDFFAGMQSTFKEFEEWLEEPIPASVTQMYEKAVAKMEECLPFEDALVS